MKEHSLLRPTFHRNVLKTKFRQPGCEILRYKLIPPKTCPKAVTPSIGPKPVSKEDTHNHPSLNFNLHNVCSRSRWWNFQSRPFKFWLGIDRSDGQFFKAMEWRWCLKILTITIDGSWQDQPLAAMVFNGFSNFGDQWLTMVTNWNLRQIARK